MRRDTALGHDAHGTPEGGPDADRARQHCAHWLRECGLLKEGGGDSYLAELYAEGAARSYPYARGADLDLAAQVCTWVAMTDDRFDRLARSDPHEAMALCWELTAVALQEPGAEVRSADPLVRAWAGLWARQADGMSMAWRHRAGRNWNAWFTACGAELAHRGRRTVLDLDAYLAFRRIAVIVYPFIDLIERLGHFEVPPSALEPGPLTELQGTTCDVITLTNDVYSLPKEERAGDPHNSILVLEHTHGYGRDAALAHVRRLTAQRHEHFHQLRGRLGALCDRLNLPHQERAAVERCADGCAHLLQGNADWLAATARYRSPAPQPTHDAP